MCEVACVRVCVCGFALNNDSFCFVHLFNYLEFLVRKYGLHAAKTLAISLNNIIIYDNFSLPFICCKAFHKQPGINNTK